MLSLINDVDNSYVLRIAVRFYFERIKEEISNFLRLIYN
jgi:hypothetical protein